MIVEAATGERAEPLLVDRRSGRPLQAPEFMVTPGPAASKRIKDRYARLGDRKSGGRS